MRRLAFALVAVAAAALAWVGWRALRPAPSDEAQIRALLERAAEAAGEKRVGDAVADLSDRFQGEGLDRQGAKQLVALHVLRGTWVSVAVTGARIAPEGDAARAAVDVLLSRGGKGARLADLLPEQASVHRFQLALEREPGGWKVVRARWRPVTLEEATAGPELADAPGAPAPSPTR
ncbi:MAG TPA: hypothetical protein VFP65_09140 [Anaeromyxobacteraceae bacterium]|nr:hypothetical protein [Anaeromyxobacteraceae bacterium]